MPREADRGMRGAAGPGGEDGPEEITDMEAQAGKHKEPKHSCLFCGRTIKIGLVCEKCITEDELADQMTIKAYYDPFTGEEYPKRGKTGNPFKGSQKPKAK